MDTAFLEILRCPATRQSLRLADETERAILAALISSGQAVNRAGTSVQTMPSEALLTVDNQWAYPVVEGIPVLLSDEAISLSEISFPRE